MAEEEAREWEEEDGVERETGGRRERDFLRSDRNLEQRDPVIGRFSLCGFLGFRRETVGFSFTFGESRVLGGIKSSGKSVNVGRGKKS